MKYQIWGTIGIAVAVVGGWWLEAAYRLDKRTYLEQDELREEECGDIGYIHPLLSVLPRKTEDKRGIIDGSWRVLQSLRR